MRQHDTNSDNGQNQYDQRLDGSLHPLPPEDTQPASVSNAVLATWGVILVVAVSAVAQRYLGMTDPDYFYSVLIACCLSCIFPYKIDSGKNWARYAYGVVFGYGLATMLSGDMDDLSRVDTFLIWALKPVEGWIVYSLFKQESNRWFLGGAKHRQS